MTVETIEVLAWAAIICMAVATWLTRIGGFWLMRLVPEGGFIDRSLGHLPGCLVVAILAPFAVSGDWGAPAAILAAVLIGRLGLSAIVAVFGAMGLVALLRLLLASETLAGL